MNRVDLFIRFAYLVSEIVNFEEVDVCVSLIVDGKMRFVCQAESCVSVC